MKEIKIISQTLRGLAHGQRMMIMRTINKSTSGELCVGSIYKQLKIEQSVCSQQLAKLFKAGLVTKERRGKQIFYRCNIQGLQTELKKVTEMLGI